MSTLRRMGEHPWSAVPKAALSDERLSWRARGLLAFLLSKPDGWRVDRHALSRGENVEGKAAIAAALRELRAAGWYHVAKVRTPAGKFTMESRLFDEPQEPDPALDDPHLIEVEPPVPENRAPVVRTPADTAPTTYTVSGDGENPLATPDGDAENVTRIRPRKPDVIWDAMLAACHVDPAAVTASARGAYNKARKDLATTGATPEAIAAMGQEFDRRWPGKINPTALARRWPELAPQVRTGIVAPWSQR